MKKFLVLVLAFLLMASNAYAIEVTRQKNVATYIVFPIMKNDGTLISGAAGLDSEIDTFGDAAAPDGFTDCTNEATEIGSTGQYYLSVTQAEMNVDYSIIQIKSSTTGAVTQTMLIRTMVGDPLLFATSDDGGVINVTGGAVDTVTTATTATNVTTVNGLAANVITAASIAADAIGASEIAADAIGASEIANDAITAAKLQDGCITSTEIADDAIDAGAIAANAIGASEIATDAIGAAEIAADAIGASEIAASAITSSEAPNLDAAISTRSTLTAANVWDTNISAYSGAGYAGTYVKGVFDKLPTNYIMGSSVLTAKDDEIDAILTDTAAMDTSTELRTLLTGSDTAVSTLTTSSAIGSVTGAVGSVTGNVGGNVAGSVASVTGAVGSVTAGVTVATNNDKTGYALSDAGVDAIWNETQSGHTLAGTFGKYLDAQVSGIGGGSLTVQDIVNGVWNELVASHTTLGSFSELLNGAKDTNGAYSDLEKMIRSR